MRKFHIVLICCLLIFNLIGIFALYRGITINSFQHRIPKNAKVGRIKAISMPLGLVKTNEQIVAAGRGVKSVVLNPQDSLLYALNLEGMSVYEYDVQTKRNTRKLIFEATEGKGFDYTKRVWYSSKQEKPVEGCFTHKGRYLWISLHNAEGVVVWDRELHQPYQKGTKKAYLTNGNDTDTLGLPFFKTGKTPKVIVASQNDDFIFVANWHSNTISVIDIRLEKVSEWKVVDTLTTGAVPRGIAINNVDSRLYVGNMGSATLSSYHIKNASTPKPTFVQDTIVTIGFTPRHLVHRSPYLYATLSSPENLLKIEASTHKTIKKVSTADDPRTVAISPDGTLLFVVCYAENLLQVFRSHDLALLASWSSKGKPVGIAVRQPSPSRYEAWVCNYTASSIKIFSIEKK